VKIAYVVDVHDRFDAVPRAAEQTGPVDVLVVGGDITTGGTPDDAARAVESWRPLAPHLLALAGNMDSPAIDARLIELEVALDARGVRYDDVGLFGVSAAPISPLDTPYELPDDELERRVECLLDRGGGCFGRHSADIDTPDRNSERNHARRGGSRSRVRTDGGTRGKRRENDDWKKDPLHV
jgi:Icc-related predicted phosphoesterase